MGRARAMLIQAGLEPKYKDEFWCELISTATKLDNIMLRRERKKPLTHCSMERMQSMREI